MITVIDKPAEKFLLCKPRRSVNLQVYPKTVYNYPIKSQTALHYRYYENHKCHRSLPLRTF